MQDTIPTLFITDIDGRTHAVVVPGGTTIDQVQNREVEFHLDVMLSLGCLTTLGLETWAEEIAHYLAEEGYSVDPVFLDFDTAIGAREMIGTY